MRIGYCILDDPAALERQPDEPVMELFADSALDTSWLQAARLQRRAEAGDKDAQAELNAMELEQGVFVRLNSDGDPI